MSTLTTLPYWSYSYARYNGQIAAWDTLPSAYGFACETPQSTLCMPKAGQVSPSHAATHKSHTLQLLCNDDESGAADTWTAVAEQHIGHDTDGQHMHTALQTQTADTCRQRLHRQRQLMN